MLYETQNTPLCRLQDYAATLDLRMNQFSHIKPHAWFPGKDESEPSQSRVKPRMSRVTVVQLSENWKLPVVQDDTPDAGSNAVRQHLTPKIR